ncbi:hypothetical protein GCM10011579_029030 [Streptomyces albiflavescens]|uniref:Uncharacterized protein n=1 Tax=Streptomyces albiflavescens TaxID=1623582 RepID=A0A917Y287_9ACTN|nr:hypothetical protein GCM10011579_029030 [Streptomyces albiflavescens]
MSLLGRHRHIDQVHQGTLKGICDDLAVGFWQRAFDDRHDYSYAAWIRRGWDEGADTGGTFLPPSGTPAPAWDRAPEGGCMETVGQRRRSPLREFIGHERGFGLTRANLSAGGVAAA